MNSNAQQNKLSVKEVDIAAAQTFVLEYSIYFANEA